MNVEIDFNKIRPLNNSRNEGFEELCCQLARLELQDLYSDAFDSTKFHRKGGKAGDAGVECYYSFPDGSEWGWQAKYFIDELAKSQWPQMDRSVKRALEKHPRLVKYIICLPVNLSDARTSGRLSQKDRWNERVEKWTKWADELGRQVEFEKWEESALRQRLVGRADERAGYILYWFDEKIFTQEWFKKRLDEAVKDAGPRYSAELHVDLPIAGVFDAFGRTDAFLNRFRALYSELYKKWNRTKPGELPKEKAPELASSIDDLAEMVEGLGAELKKCAAESFEPICLETLRCLSSDLSERLNSCIEETKKEEYQQVAESQQRTAGQYIPTSRELASAAQDDLRNLDLCVSEIVNFTYEEVARTANHSVLLVAGEAGTGKTHLFCDVAKHRIEVGLPTVLLLGEKFAADKGPWGQIADQLLLNHLGPEEFLGALDAVAQVAGRRAFILIDALNEGQGFDLWNKYFRGMTETIQQYPHVVLAVSCRDTYEEDFIPRAMIENEELHRVCHLGFEGHEYDATQKFFEHFCIEAPTAPILVPEFSNPLFLKLLCSGLSNEGIRRIPQGFRGITKVFDFFIESTNLKLSRDLAYDLDDELVQRAVGLLSHATAEKAQGWLEKSQAKRIINQIRSEPDQYEKTLYRNLLHEGVLKEDRRLIIHDPKMGNRRETTVSFAYERLANHLIVKYWLDKGFDAKRPVESLISMDPLRLLVSDESYARRYAGWVWALSIQLPERSGKEALEFFPGVKSWEIFQRGFLRSLIWRSPEKTTPATKELFNQLREMGPFAEWIYEVSLMVSCEPAHILNAFALHQDLSRLSMAERDANWSIYLHDQYAPDEHDTVDRLIEWAWNTDKSKTEDEVIELCAITLSWFLASSNRFLRDRATKALVSMLRARPRVLLKILKRFQDVEDQYVIERICAVAYGVAMLSEDTDAVRDIAKVVYRSVFAQGRAPAHLLLRDYARGVVELAAHRNALPEDIAFHKIIPPYESAWPLEPVDPDELEQYGESPDDDHDPAWTRVWLYHSIVGDSNFTRYAIDQGCRDFSRRLLGDICSSAPESESSDAALQRYTERFDCELAQRWIVRRVFSLGWTAERFGHFDKRIGRHQSHWETHKPERIGKKYTWIALHEFLARLADNVEYCEDTWGLEPDEYCGPWQLLRRDIDPSFLMRQTQETGWGKESKTWWQPVDYAFGERDEERFEDWTKDVGDLFAPANMIEVVDPQGNRWLVLESVFHRIEQLPVEEDEYSGRKRSVGLRIRGYLVQSDHVEVLLEWLKDQKLSTLPAPTTVSQVFLGEYPWAPAFKQYDIQDPWTYGNYIDQPHPIIVTAARYSWEREYDCSIDDSINGFVPSAWVVRSMGLRWSGQGFEFRDHTDSTVTVDPSAEEAGPGALLVSKDFVEGFLEKNNLKLIWSVVGDRTVFGQSGYSWKTILQGVYCFEAGKVIGGPPRVTTPD